MPAKKKDETKIKPVKKGKRERETVAAVPTDQVSDLPPAPPVADTQSSPIHPESAIVTASSRTITDTGLSATQNSPSSLAQNSPLGHAVMTAQTIATTTGTPVKQKTTPPPQGRERFDLNTVTLSGVIHSVWGSDSDVFARLGISKRGLLVEEEDAQLVYVTLRFEDGVVKGEPVSLGKGIIVKVRGYLTHREYSETIRRFLDEAHASTFFELVPPEDLPVWRGLEFKRQNGVMNVLEMIELDPHGAPVAKFGFEDDGHMSAVAENHIKAEGIVSRIWEYPHDDEIDLFARIAVYDAYTPVSHRHAGKFGRSGKSAHYITLRFPCGKTSTGSVIRLKPKMRIRVAGELRDKLRVVTLREELLATGDSHVAEMMQRVQSTEKMDEISNRLESLHVLANAVIVYSFGGGSRS